MRTFLAWLGRLVGALAIFCLLYAMPALAQRPLPEARQGKQAAPHTIRYNLHIADTAVNYTGRTRHALAINGSIPAPTLSYTEGDTAEIWVYNHMRHQASIHWHGLILHNTEDGVPYLTTAPIAPGKYRVFRFPIVQSGTYWYHSHTGVQAQSGLYGAFIIHPRTPDTLPEATLLLSEWADMNPKEIDRSLHNQTDWFAIRKGAVQSYAEAIRHHALRIKLRNEWKRMTAMDVSDVAYDRLLINGDTAPHLPALPGGREVRLHIINGGASTYFWLTYGAGPITVVATDGQPVQPVEVGRLIIAVAETYDVIVRLPAHGQAEFRATSEDRTRAVGLWLGSGPPVPAPRLPRLSYFDGMQMMNDMMLMDGNLGGMEGMQMANQSMDMNMVMYPELLPGTPYATPDVTTLKYTMLKAPKPTTLPPGPQRTFRFTLTGNMNRYVWSINNKTVSEARRIFIAKGDVIRIVIYNNSMMRHPMHLHGHFFRVLNGQGAFAPLKNVLDIMPMETDTIEFAATEPGDWFFHCHILYHMMAGMGRIFSYTGTPPNLELPKPAQAQRRLFADDRMAHVMARASLQTNGSDGEAMLANTRFKLQTMWHLGAHPHHGYEVETNLGRYLGRNQWWHAYIGFDYHYKPVDAMGMPDMPAKHPFGEVLAPNFLGNDATNLFGQRSNKNNRHTAVAGLQYTLPLLFIADARVDALGKFRFMLSREDIPLTPRLRMDMMLNTDREYMLGLRYIATKYISATTHYDSDMGLGIGLAVTY